MSATMAIKQMVIIMASKLALMYFNCEKAMMKTSTAIGINPKIMTKTKANLSSANFYKI